MKTTTFYPYRILLALLLGVFPSLAAGFDLQSYYTAHRSQDRATFINNFPYATYLREVQFTDFKTLQGHRHFLWQRLGDGDDFLYYLGEAFMTYYPPQITHLAGTIAVGEAYLAEKQKLGIATAANEIYQIIGYFILGKVAQTLKEEIRRGKFDPDAPDNAALLKRLEDNRIYVTIERGTLQKLIENVKKKNWSYITDRLWLQFRETEQKGSERYNDLLGPDFFSEFYQMGSPPPAIPATASKFSLSEYRKYYPSGGDHAVNILTIQDRTKPAKSATIGYAIWLKRPDLKATYFAHQNVTTKFRQWASKTRQTVVLATTGGFTNIHKKPEGLTLENGTVVNAVLMPDRDGLIIVHKNGGISVINLKRDHIKLSLGPQTVLTIENPLNSLIAYSKLLTWCQANRATLFQTQLLAFSDQLLIDAGKAKGQLRERRLLVLARNIADNALYHIICDIPIPYNLAVIAEEIFTLCRSRGVKVEAILNLDVGSYNILNVFDQRGKLLAQPQGPVNINKATNLIIYSR